MSEDTTCLILGGSSDIGRAIAREFAQLKFDIMLAARRLDDDLKSFAKDLAIRNDVSVTIHEFDAVNFASHPDFIEHLPVQPTVVASVFGYLGVQNLAESDFTESQKIIETNFLGHVSILNLFATRMETDRSGTIIGISSVAGDRGRRSNYLYGASKAAMTTYLSGPSE